MNKTWFYCKPLWSCLATYQSYAITVFFMHGKKKNLSKYWDKKKGRKRWTKGK